MKEASTRGAAPADGEDGGDDRRMHEHAACRELAASVAHELNNSLLPVVLLAELTRDDLPAGDALRTNMSRILDAAEQARVYLDRIREFGRSQDLERRPVALAMVVEKSIGRLRSALPPTVELRLEIAGGDGRILADADKIADVIVELGSNAVEAFDGAAGSIEFEAGETRIEAGDGNAPPALTAGRYARFLVRDNGPGMAPEAIARAFDPFFAGKAERGARGLGLAIAYGVVSGHAGAIVLGGSAGEGTRVELYLPMIE